MPPTHFVVIKDPDGTNPRIIGQNPPGTDPTRGGYSNLVYSNVVNGYGTCAFSLYGDHLALSGLQDFSQVEVWREWPELGVTLYRDWSGLFRDEDSAVTTDTGDLTTLTCYGDAFWLSTASIAYPANTASRSKFSGAAGETIMKTLVTRNVGAGAITTDGRDRNHIITGISVEADGANGSTLDWACANENLLQNLQKLAPVAGGDFDLVKTGAQAWEFRWYTGQRGTDRSASVKFSLELGNMANPAYRIARSEEKTVALVKGSGTDANRAKVIRTGPNYSAANNVEMYVNASSQATTTDTLNAAGDAELKNTQAAEVITFDALPVGNVIYGLDWFLGDKVSAKYKAHSLTPRVVMVTVTVDPDQGEIVTPGMATNV